MQTEQIEFDTVDQQQAVFGMQDQFAKIIEKELNVSISLRDSRAEIKGEPGRNTKIAAEVMDSLLTLYKRGENLKEGIVYRLLEEAAEGNLDETCKAMDSVVTITQKGAPIKCKTFGQKNYVKALQDHVVTICICLLYTSPSPRDS